MQQGPAVHAFVAVLRAADRLQREAAEVLKAHGLTPSQYNALRILRGAEPGGCRCNEIGARLIQHDPDVTRLVDRLEKQGLVKRERDSEDRRAVVVRITPKGMAVLNDLDRPVAELHKEQFRHLSTEEIRQLTVLLSRLGAERSS